MINNHYIKATWPAPPFIKACATLRYGGHSLPPFDSYNLSTSVLDDVNAVLANRLQLQTELNLQKPPLWIKQIHSAKVIYASNNSIPLSGVPEADAIWTDQPQVTCAILTADCLPVLLCHPQGKQIAAIHAGWRGLSAGVIENTLNQLSGPFTDWLVWLGPAIGPTAFEVGQDVWDTCITVDIKAKQVFQPIQTASQKWLLNIYALAKQRLTNYGISHIYGGEYCTWSQKDLFYSYRRDQHHSGRMASLIWIDHPILP